MTAWTEVGFGDILRPNKRPYELGPAEDADLVGMRWYGQGPFHRECKSALQIRKKSHFVIRSGDVIYNKLFAWKGAFGVVPAKLDGMFVSDKFPTYEFDERRVDRGFLRWYFRYPRVWDQAKDLSKGAAALSKLTLNPPDFLRLRIPLPPLMEQQKLVERLDAMIAKIDEANRLRTEVDVGLSELCRSMIRGGDESPCRPTPMHELVRLREPDVQVLSDETYHFAGVYCFGQGVFVGQRKSGMEFKYPRLTRLRTGDFVYPKLMAWEGALAVVPPECDGLVVSTEYPVFEIDTTKVLPDVLDIHFRTPSVWPELSGQSTGTNVRRRRLNPRDFLRYEFPVPPMAMQHRLKMLNELAAAISKEHLASAKELDAMLPSILDKAFGGSLWR